MLLLFQNCSKKETFEVGNKTFLLNGKPFVVKAAEMHYPRIPQEYWEHRIKMCKALGMNAICLYVFWNIHEPEEGQFDFTGNNDVAAFCRLAQKHGMYLILRPGPYVCAEWEMGGLPWWLLKKKDVALRTQDQYFMERVRLFMAEVGKQLGGLQLANGGNILMVQVENEYGAYGIDKPYVAEVLDIVKASGFDKTPLFQCDWSSNFENNALDDLLWTVNFGVGANIDEQFKRLKELRPETPLMCSEYWSGWFDHWGAKHETRSADELVAGMKQMLDKNISFSLYMTHGGTSFGHWAGANFPGYVPDCTSYDYDAPVSESGRATPKYFKVRELLQTYLSEGEILPDVPDSIPTISIPSITFNEIAPLFDNLPEPVTGENIQSMEFFNQGWGSILYRTTLKQSAGRQFLKVTEAHDWAQVFIDGERIGILNRLKGESSLSLPPVNEGAVLDILVEAMGRRNFGAGVLDYKGITEKVEIINKNDTAELKDWKVYSFPVNYAFAKNKKYVPINGSTSAPVYYRTVFHLNKTGDTFLDMSNWTKGMVYVNGHNIGRFWEIGPQQTLYMPGCWLRKGKNEIIVLDMAGTENPTVSGLRQPVLDVLRGNGAYKFRKQGETLDLSDETPVYTGRFKAGNGWQKIPFGKA
jgi:beta-galactosidase